MKKFTVILAIIILAGLSLQSFFVKSDSFYESRKQYWDTAREVTIAVAEAMPADKYSYQPTDSIRTFAGQMAHIAQSSVFIYNGLILEKKRDPNAPAPPKPEEMSKEDMIASLNNMFDVIAEGMKNISDAELKKEVKVFNGKMMTKQELFHFLQDHITNHRAKANLYIRMNGVKPPRYGY